MKKHLIAIYVAVILCLVALCGCNGIKALEKDLQVTLEVNGEYYGCYTVNIFNNAAVPEPEAPAGMTFAGWTASEGWDAAEAENVPVIQNKGLVRYDDVKNFVTGKSANVTLRAVFVPVPKRDLVVAWYDKEATSGISSAHMDGFKVKLYAYLTDEGLTPEEMDIVIRGYAGDVGASCGQIKKDGDVDIMIGWSTTSNLTSTGGLTEGVDFIENVGKITVGSKARYAARLTDTELCKKVYIWLQNEYGEGYTPPNDPVTPPDDPPEIPIPASETRLVIGWYNLEDTSGLNQTIIDNFENGLKEYLTEQGKTVADLTIRLRAYEDDVATSCGLIKTHGDVDIMLGWGGNISSKGNMVEGTDYIENVGSIAMGVKTRYIARITDTALVNMVFDWIEAGDAAALLAVPQPDPPEEPTPPVDPDPPQTDTAIKIGWWKNNSSGLTQEIIDTFEAGLKAYLTSEGYDLTSFTVTFVALDGNLATTAGTIKTDGDFDVVLGYGVNLKSTGGVEYVDRIDGIDMGTQTGRYIYQLSDKAVAKLVFDWTKTDGAKALLATV